MPPGVLAAPSSRAQRSICLSHHLLPAVLIVGAQKAGTTSLYADLMRTVVGASGGRALPNEPAYYAKETHFFDRTYAAGAKYYVQHFRPCPLLLGTSLFAIDATPDYLKVIGSAERARETYLSARASAAVRIVVVLRNPTDRARSWFDHQGRHFHHSKLDVSTWARESLRRMAACAQRHQLPLGSGRLWGSACNTLGGEFGDALIGGLYAPQLGAWVRAFGPRQVAIVTFGGYLTQTARVLSDLAHFFGRPLRLGTRKGGGSPKRGLHASRRSARADNATLAPTRPAADAHPRRALLTAAHHNVQSGSASTLGKRERAALDGFYRPHVRELIQFLREPGNRALVSTPFAPASSLTSTMLV